MSSGLSFVALGVGDGFSARHYSSCLAVESEGRWILVDRPHPIRNMLHDSREATGGRDLDRMDAMLLTHLHADHCSGAEGLAYYSHFVLGRRVTLVAHPLVARRLWSGHLIHAGGCTLGVSGDTAFDPRLVSWLAEADLIIHESNSGAHTPYETLVGLLLAIRERMRLIHLPDGFDEIWTEIPALTEGVRHVV